MTIQRRIEQVREQLRRGDFTSEASVSQGILLPILYELGWPIFDTKIVIPEYSVGGKRVDFALCSSSGRSLVFIEVKKVGFIEGADRQLFEYAFHIGVPMAVLTDGQEWSFYLPAESGHYEERRVYKIDLLERDVAEITTRLERYLQYGRVQSGEALKAAREDYQNVSREREIQRTLPKAWKSLLAEPDSLLVELLAEKVEDLCGYKPTLDVCNKFLATEYRNNFDSVRSTSNNSPTIVSYSRQQAPENCKIASQSRTTGGFSFVFNGNIYTAGSAQEVMRRVFQLLAEHDKGFLERFAARKHGRKRRYISRDRMELYPDRPDLVESHSVEFVPGWWLGTNYSRNNIQQILDLALEVVDPRLRALIQVDVTE